MHVFTREFRINCFLYLNCDILKYGCPGSHDKWHLGRDLRETVEPIIGKLNVKLELLQLTHDKTKEIISTVNMDKIL